MNSWLKSAIFFTVKTSVMYKWGLFIFLFWSSYSIGQTPEFTIRFLMEGDSLPRLDENNYKVDPTRFYEDDRFVVSTTCSGEGGGTIKFREKRGRFEYAAAASCPIVVNKLNGRYYVSNTRQLYAEVLEIKDPTNMELLNYPPAKVERARKEDIKIKYVGEDESKSTQGVKKLVDSVGIQLITSFPYQNELYHIVLDFDKVYLAKIENERFVAIETIFPKSNMFFASKVFTKHDGHQLIFFSRSGKNGYFDIFENTILIVNN